MSLLQRIGLWRLPLGKVPEVSSKELKSWLEQGKPVQLVDSRTLLEYKQGTIGSAKHAAVTELPQALEHLGLDPQKPVVFLCLSGHRSRPGTRLLRQQGFQAFSLRGGVTAWKLAGFPLRKPNPKPTRK